MVPGEPGTLESESLFCILTAVSVPFKDQEALDVVWTRDCPVVTYKTHLTLPNKILFSILSSLDDHFSAYNHGCLSIHLCTFITTIQIHILCNMSKGLLVEYSHMRF